MRDSAGSDARCRRTGFAQVRHDRRDLYSVTLVAGRPDAVRWLLLRAKFLNFATISRSPAAGLSQHMGHGAECRADQRRGVGRDHGVAGALEPWRSEL
jgi:hypothetical protein